MFDRKVVRSQARQIAANVSKVRMGHYLHDINFLKAKPENIIASSKPLS